jgi:hypothetical protein
VAARADGRDVGSPAEPQGGAGGLPGSAGGASATGGGTVELKGGALWWQHVRSSTGGGTAELKYGSNFVLQRPGSVGGAGLVRAVRPPKPVRRSPPTPPLPPVVWRAPGAAAGGAGLVLSGSSLASGSVVIDTECFVLPTPGQQQAQQQQQQLLPGAIPPNTTCVGIVWQPSADPQAEAAAQPPARRGRSSKHPRRTQMVSEGLAGRLGGLAGQPSLTQLPTPLRQVNAVPLGRRVLPALIQLPPLPAPAQHALPAAALHLQPVWGDQ